MQGTCSASTLATRGGHWVGKALFGLGKSGGRDKFTSKEHGGGENVSQTKDS